MGAAGANFLNAVVLIGAAMWAYLPVADPSVTVLIPAAFGVVLMTCTPGLRRENKVVAHVAALLTLVVLVALVVPLRGALSKEETLPVLRVSAMMLTSAVALGMFIRFFVAARRARG